MSGARQLLLDLAPDWTPTLDNYVAGANDELLGRLRALTESRSFDAVYLWGPAGCGKSHLLAAAAGEARGRRPVRLCHAAEVDGELAPAGGALLVIDDVHRLGAAAQVALFRAFNAARMTGLALLLAGRCPPRELELREDLRTRIGQCLIYEVRALSDSEKDAALRRHALLRGMKLDDGVVQYLMRHGRRDLPSLMAMLDALDRGSLEQKRQPTVPLLRELMQTSLELDNDESGAV